MAFKNERLTEQDKEFIASFKFTRPLGQINELAEIPERWTADRERNIFLICLGGQGRRYSEEYPPNYYHLIIGNAVISIEAMFQEVGSNAQGLKVTWKILIIDVSKELSYLKSEEIIKIIKEVFVKRSYSGYSTDNNVLSVKFDFIANPIFKKN